MDEKDAAQESKLNHRVIANREMILQGASEVFSKSGYSATSLADIAKHTRVTEEEIFVHFSSKNVIGEEIIRRQHELSLGIGRRIFAENRPAIEQIIVATTEVAHQLVSQPIVRAGLRLSTESSMFFPNYVKKPYLDWIETFTSAFRVAIAQGDVDDSEDPRELGRFIANMFVGTQVVSGVLTNWEDLFDQLPVMWKKILPSIIVKHRQNDLFPRLVAMVR
jgi:AcrR family transcriptional regulator